MGKIAWIRIQLNSENSNRQHVLSLFARYSVINGGGQQYRLSQSNAAINSE